MCDDLRLEFNQQKEVRHVYAKGNVKFTSTGEQPWELTADSAEGVFAASGVLDQIIAKKNVVVRDAQRSLEAQLLQLFFQQQQDTAELSLSRALATGEVSVLYRRPTEDVTAHGDKLEWSARTEDYVLTGKPAWVAGGPEGGLKGPKITMNRLTGHVTLTRGGTEFPDALR